MTRPNWVYFGVESSLFSSAETTVRTCNHKWADGTTGPGQGKQLLIASSYIRRAPIFLVVDTWLVGIIIIVVVTQFLPCISDA